MFANRQVSLATLALDWPWTTTEIFSRLSHQPWAMLLDSAHASHVDARFDILCFAPIATLQCRANGCFLSENNSSQLEFIDKDPFDALAQVQARYFPNPQPSALPFSGGLMGYLSYDLGREVESIPATASADISLPTLAMGVYDFALVYDYHHQTWQLIHCQGQQALEHCYQQLLAMMATEPAPLPDFGLTQDWQSQISQADYHDKFEQIQAYLHSGDCYQINLTQRFSASYHGDEWQAYQALRAANSAPFSAFIRLPEQAILSISPERFISLNQGNIQTKPIKGTLPRHADPHQDQANAMRLAASEKDRAENLMIVDLLRNDIGKVASAGSVNVPKLFDIESFPAVHHLVSTVCARLDDRYQAADLLKACFPGGSITGAPKIRAMEIIEQLEPSRRAIYCGSIGYISQDNQMDTNICIRTLLAEDQRLYCWAGGGIVADSTAASEYQESFDKLSKILPVLSQLNAT
ncbi:aminodeoxychorismate synthase component I [Shewanella sp. NIFS-20-20]|uniref:aminodeoxychorismate synthase component I n=1 Tax=Shewanella sp. NIFS-20-20 TaxID=2853806 RepID=UPI001C458942|nr:aminodeoxychorismate synthase component I [Shewanella sp. NIFS-20-20]MBV7315059.1 aminodeoxychorismate synthase component I [Shewanella sp. NIFS-20-20]